HGNRDYQTGEPGRSGESLKRLSDRGQSRPRKSGRALHAAERERTPIMNNGATRFHGSYKMRFAPLVIDAPHALAVKEQVAIDGPPPPSDEPRMEHTRSLSYRFYPHFHPYAEELMQRLLQHSVAGLQAADTEYVENSDGTLVVLPDSLMAKLGRLGTMVVGREGEPFLPVGTPLRLPDKAIVPTAGKDVALIGELVLDPARGVLVPLAPPKLGKPEVFIKFGDEV